MHMCKIKMSFIITYKTCIFIYNPINKILIEIQCVFFYWVKSICSFDTLKIALDWSNISKILLLVRTFNKNTPRISLKILLRPFFYNFAKRGIFHYFCLNVLSKKWPINMQSTKALQLVFIWKNNDVWHND